MRRGEATEAEPEGRPALGGRGRMGVFGWVRRRGQSVRGPKREGDGRRFAWWGVEMAFSVTEVRERT